jgi:hypothetical protein
VHFSSRTENLSPAKFPCGGRAYQTNIVKAVEAQSAKAISNRNQRISKRMFAPVKARFGNSINFSAAALIRDNGSAGIMTITFKT